MNTDQKIRVKLGGVQETLFLPLYLRALETQRPDPIIQDPLAVQILPTIDYDFIRYNKAKWLQLDVAIRTEVLDEQVSKFIGQHPDAIVINLGAGLDARFERLDNNKLRWFDLDMPDSMALRRMFFKENARRRFIAKSMFDYSWIDDIDRYPNQPVLLIAEGLLHYFEKKQIQELFHQIATRLPGRRSYSILSAPCWLTGKQRCGD
jgi:O-methyltransferase involved in polyketide biosynthesis